MDKQVRYAKKNLTDRLVEFGLNSDEATPAVRLVQKHADGPLPLSHALALLGFLLSVCPCSSSVRFHHRPRLPLPNRSASSPLPLPPAALRGLSRRPVASPRRHPLVEFRRRRIPVQTPRCRRLSCLAVSPPSDLAVADLVQAAYI